MGTSRTLPFDAQKKKWAISLLSRISRSLFLLPPFSEGVCLFWHGLHGHCVLTAKKKKWAISLSSRISRSLVLLPQFSEGVCPFRHRLHGHSLLTQKKNGLYRSRRGFHGVWSFFHNFQKGCFRFGTTSRTLPFDA